MTLRVHFFKSDKSREWLLADAVLGGAARHGCITTSSSLGQDYDPSTYDVACFVGVKSRELYRQHHDAGVHCVYFDKGYTRGKSHSPVGGWEFWRVSINGHHPTKRLAALEMPTDRFDALGLDIRKWNTSGSHILIAGSSAKYHAFYGLKDPTTFARDCVREIRGITERPIWYRPKPSWRDAHPIIKTRYSKPPETIVQALGDAWAMVTHGSNACFEAMVLGIPSIVLGDAVARPISSTAIADIRSPRLATDTERRQLLANIAYHQWTLAEFSSGAAWEFIRQELHSG